MITKNLEKPPRNMRQHSTTPELYSRYILSSPGPPGHRQHTGSTHSSIQHTLNFVCTTSWMGILSVCMSLCVYTCVCLHVCLCLHGCMCMCIYVRMHTQVYVRVCTHREKYLKCHHRNSQGYCGNVF